MEETIRAVIGTLKALFSDKGELKGFGDWDALIGCVMALENIAAELSQEPQEETLAEE